MKRLVVIPSDPIAAYEKAGYDWLERYYNPTGMFDEVFALSPFEQGARKAYGMTIRGARDHEFTALLRDLRPQVVRAYGGYWPADFGARNRLTDIPFIVSVHDSLESQVHGSLRFADLVMCTSSVVKQRVLEKGVDSSRIRMLPNRVDLDVFKSVQPPWKESFQFDRFLSGKHILHVGRRSEQKNLDTMIKALALLPIEYSCIFVGMGDSSPYLAMAREHGVESRCFWIDSVKNSELPAWYSWCDCMCTPSRWEGFGIVFIEAAACGAPIVTSDIAPMNEYLVGDESACLVREFEDPAAIAAAVRKVCVDADYRSRISAGAKKAAEPFERKRVDELEAAFYREAMDMTSLRSLRWMEWMIWKHVVTRHG